MLVELNRAKDYALNLADRVIGTNYSRRIRESIKVSETLNGKDNPDKNSLSAMFLVFGIMAPTTTGASFSKAVIDSSLAKERPSNFFQILAFSSSIAIDTMPVALALIAGEPTYLLGRPILGAAAQVVTDIIEGRLLNKQKLPKATLGTHDLLEELSRRFYDPNIKGGIIRNADGQIIATVVKEPLCAAGGSCMELRAIARGHFEYVHVTKEGHIVSIQDNNMEPNKDILERADALVKAII